MGLMDIFRRRANEEGDEKRKSFAGKTFGKQYNYFDKERASLDRMRLIYDTGGLVPDAIDTYPLYTLGNGYRLEGKSPEMITRCKTILDSMDTYNIMFTQIRDALVVKRGVAEIIPTLGGDVVRLVPCVSETFKQNTDDKGNVLGYTQTVSGDGGRKVSVEFTPDRIFWLDLQMPLIERAYDDIARDTKVIESITKAMERHGFPRYHITVGEPGEIIADATIDSIGRQFEELKPQSEMVTQAGVKIDNLDSMGLANAKVYSDISIQRLCTALGVPEEMLGLGRGSTEATANVRLQAFYDKIGSIQERVARAWNLQVLDRITKIPGAVKLVFEDVSPVEETMTADMLVKLASINPADPFAIVSPEWMKERLGITDERDGTDTAENPKKVEDNAQSSNSNPEQNR